MLPSAASLLLLGALSGLFRASVALLSQDAVASTPSAEVGAQVNVPEEQQLRARLEEFWQAVGAHDIVKRYQMTTPTVRKLVPLDAFKKTWEWQQRPEFPLQNMTAELARVCGCVELRLLRCTVLVDLVIAQPGESLRYERTAQMWEFAEGQWYEAYSGAPSGRRCPGVN
jgi:hypothetical protein